MDAVLAWGSMEVGGATRCVIAVIFALLAAASPAAGAPNDPVPVATPAFLLGIQQGGATLGEPRAPVTIEEYSDLECPLCAQFAQQTLPAVVEADVRTGVAKLTFRSLQTATTSNATFVAQQTAALAAGRQNLLWQYVYGFYAMAGPEGSGYVTPAFLARVASATPGLNVAQWSAQRGGAALRRSVARDAQTGSSLGLSATPASVVRGPGGTRTVVGVASARQIEAAVAAVRRRR